jgi:hypothetical protein
MRLDEQVECSRSETISLTPRLIAVRKREMNSKLFQQFFCPMDVNPGNI